MAQRDEKKKAWLLGVGFDNEDGHVRITRGENFQLVGGSHETHECMQEKAIKLNEKLSERGKRLEDVSQEELHDIVSEIGIGPSEGKTPEKDS